MWLKGLGFGLEVSGRPFLDARGTYHAPGGGGDMELR